MALERTINRNVRRATSEVGNTFDSIKNFAYDSLHLGVGLVALASENIGAFVKDTVKYGEKVEKQQLKRLATLQSDAARRMKNIFSYDNWKSTARITKSRAGKKSHRTTSHKAASR